MELSRDMHKKINVIKCMYNKFNVHSEVYNIMNNLCKYKTSYGWKAKMVR